MLNELLKNNQELTKNEAKDLLKKIIQEPNNINEDEFLDIISNLKFIIDKTEDLTLDRVLTEKISYNLYSQKELINFYNEIKHIIKKSETLESFGEDKLNNLGSFISFLPESIVNVFFKNILSSNFSTANKNKPNYQWSSLHSFLLKDCFGSVINSCKTTY